MKTETILEFVLRNLEKTKGKHKEIAAKTGIPYSTLTKIRQGVSDNPGINHVQALVDYFKEIEQQEKQAA